MSSVSELKAKLARCSGTEGGSPVMVGASTPGNGRPPPLPAARNSAVSAGPGSSLHSPKHSHPLPALPPQLPPPNRPRFGAAARHSSATPAKPVPAPVEPAPAAVAETPPAAAEEEADSDDLYLDPDSHLKSPSSPIKPSDTPSLPPPRKNSYRSPSQSFSAVSSSSETRGRASPGGSGDGVFRRGGPALPLSSEAPKANEDVCLEFQYCLSEDAVNPLFWQDNISGEVRGASRIGFGTDLQDKTAHDAILRLNDQELKLMETLRKVVQHKIKADKEYATSLGLISTLANRFEEDSQIQHRSSTVKTWSIMIKEVDSTSKVIRQHAEEMNSGIVDKLAMMIRDKAELKKQYIQERTKIDMDYMKVKGEVKECFSKYQRAAKEARDAKLKLDEVNIKGKAKDIERAREQCKKKVLKLHRAHNDYVLSLKAATLHQGHYRTSILPRLLECLQQSQESHIAQMKQTMSDLANLSSTCTGDFVASQNAVVRSIAELRPDMEYSNFVDSHKVESPAQEYFEFDSTIVEEFPEGLEANNIVLDNLTLESVQHTHTSLAESLEEVRAKLGEKKHELQSLDEEIRSIQPSPMEESVLLDLLSKQKIYRDVSREIQDLKCQEAKLNAQYSMLDQKLGSMGDEENLPPGIDLPEPPTLNAAQKSSTLNTHSTQEKKKSYGLTRYLKRSQDTEPKTPTEIPIEEEEWYHGALPRPDTEELLSDDGVFLVREKSDASGQYVLSVKTSGKVRHFPIQRNEDAMYRLEGTAFPTVGHLIRYQMSSGLPVTKASQACLIHPKVKVRNEHDLRHEEIDLGDKLGAGHFGDVFRGKLKKDGTPVAVKTCKETVDAATRRKFLREAYILKQYNHSNIVKLIGVCTDKHPIYIVMELVPGGDLLSFLRCENNDISTKLQVKMAEDTGAGMAFLESKNCIHRDLAARNCLVGHKKAIKISDFGMSREDDVYTIKGGAMRQIPIKWTAPEAMNFGKYTTMSDVWSFGILLWEIFSLGSTPYPGMSNPDARDKVEQGYRMPSPMGTPDEIYTLMMRCWEYHDEDRPKFREIHSILKRLSKTVR